MSMFERASPARAELLLLAIGGQAVFACLVALATGAAPAIEATIAFGLALAAGLEIQARRNDAQPVPVRTADGSGGLSPAGTRGAGRRATPRHSRRR